MKKEDRKKYRRRKFIKKERYGKRIKKDRH
jgi:hypothetical protein